MKDIMMATNKAVKGPSVKTIRGGSFVKGGHNSTYQIGTRPPAPKPIKSIAASVLTQTSKKK
jgi:hypothetical protein